MPFAKKYIQQENIEILQALLKANQTTYKHYNSAETGRAEGQGES